MKRIRFNIASLLIVILIVGVGFAALRESNNLWDSGLFTLTVGVLLISVLLAVHRKEATRAFWLGFVLFGWSYLAVSLVPPIESRLITTRTLTHLDSKMPGRLSVLSVELAFAGSGAPSNKLQAFALSPDGNQLATANQRQVKIWDAATGKLLTGWGGTTENFVRIGHSLFAMMLGSFGGLLSRRIWRASSATDISTPVHGERTNQ
jgi:hypothetical protein